MYYIALSSFAAINVLSFFMMWRDKRISVRGGNPDRTPEGILFFYAAALGAIGVYMGMLTLRHKTRKWYFQVGIPLLIIQNLVVLYTIGENFIRNYLF